MKKISLSSLFKDFSFPKDFLKMNLKDIVKIHCECLGVKFNDFIFEKLLDRVDLICDICNSGNFESLMNNYELKVEYSSDSSYIGNLIIFSKLCIDERKIVIYIESLQEIYLFLYKFLFIQIDINDFFSIAKYLCSFKLLYFCVIVSIVITERPDSSAAFLESARRMAIPDPEA